MIVGMRTHPLTGINDVADCGVARLGRVAVRASIRLRALAPDRLEFLQLTAQGVDGLARGHVGVFVRAIRLAGAAGMEFAPRQRRMGSHPEAVPAVVAVLAAADGHPACLQAWGDMLQTVGVARDVVAERRRGR